MASYDSLHVCLRAWQLRLTGHQTQKHTANKNNTKTQSKTEMEQTSNQKNKTRRNQK